MEVFNIIAGVSSIISLGISIISLVKVNGIQKSMKADTKHEKCICRFWKYNNASGAKK